MALSPDILVSDVDALSPIDETLMGAIRENLLSIDGRINGPGSSLAPVVQFKINGPLDAMLGGRLKRADIALITSAQTLSQVLVYLDQPGSGSLKIDLRKITTPRTPIVGIVPLIEASTLSVARAGAALSTTSITRTTGQISTTSITQLEPSLDVVSIVGLGDNIWQYNLSAVPGANWAVGDTVTFSGTNADGSFAILAINPYGSASVVVSNASGVAQDFADGSATLRAYAYNFANPVSTEFKAGESALFAAHTNVGNNGTLPIFAVNLIGNKIVVKNPNGATQPAAAGNVNVQRFSYNISSQAPAADYLVGDTVFSQAHTTASNNGTFVITAVNSGGNNVQVYNAAGTTQAGAAGNIQTNQFVYAIGFSAAANVIVGDEVYFSGQTSSANQGQFAVRQVNRSGALNVVVHNSAGVPQASVAGIVRHTKKLVQFSADQSSLFAVGSLFEIEGSSSQVYNSSNQYDLGHSVIEMNRGGGANYNLVIKVDGAAPPQLGQGGWVSVESRSIFSLPVELASSGQSAVVGEGSFSSPGLSAGTRLALYVLQVPVGGWGMGVQIR